MRCLAVWCWCLHVFFFKQKTAYEMRISDWSSDVCSSDLKRRAATGDDAFFNGRTSGVQRVVDAVLAFLHFNFSRAANLDHRNAASELGKTLLELLTVVIAGDRKSTRLNSSH